MRNRVIFLAGALLMVGAHPAEPQSCDNELCNLIAGGTLPELKWPSFADRRQDLTELYSFSAYRPLWIRDGKPTSQALGIIAVLKDAGSEGLDPQDYDGPLWDARVAALQSGALAQDRFDLALSVSAMRYASSLRFGRANPHGMQGCFRIGDKDTDVSTWMFRRLVSTGDPRAAFEELDPSFESYRGLRKLLAAYERMAWEDDGQKLPASKKLIEPGQAYDGIARLIAILRRTGDLAPNENAPSDSSTYRGALVDAVKRFQTRHGLDPDGRLGSKTLEELNTPLVHRVRQLQLALERLRWLPRDPSERSIVVNIPEFRLRALNASGKTELEMKVVVGKADRLQTPIFNANMRYVIFRPYWNVPPSIQRKEVAPAVEKDPSYLAKNDFEVTNSSGVVVSTGGVSDDVLAGLRSGRYQVRQRPGEKNALGRVKFVFPNENDVYLHDTPARQLFSRPRRDFSHGCIRMEKAEDLALWVLRDRPEWTRERIERAMNGSSPLQVNLVHPFPVTIVYQTAVAGEDGLAYFFDDIYGLDGTLDEQLTSTGAAQQDGGG